MLRDDRLNAIEDRLNEKGRVVAADLAEMFDVPVDMIRRDLRDLAARGACRRVYGGAIRPPVDTATMTLDHSPLAKAATAVMLPGQVVFLDGGRTNLAIAAAFDPAPSVTVVTASPSIAVALFAYPDVEVILIGGRIDRSTGSAAGAMALEAIRDWRFDVCLLGACAISEEGISAIDAEDAAMKRALIAASTEIVVAAVAAKIGTRAAFHVAPIDRVDRLIVEAGAPALELDRIRAAGVQIDQVAPRD